MEEFEDTTEKVREHMEHVAQHSNDPWMFRVALSSALLAVAAAITALVAGHHANEAMLEQIHASDAWAYYQAKGIKWSILGAKMELLEAQGSEPSKKDEEKRSEYKREQEEISRDAQEKESVSAAHLKKHLIYARGVTLFQVAIAIAAISVLTKKRRFWYGSLALGVLGLAFALQGFFA